MKSNDPFATFGITHLSPSTCNLYTGSPAAFVLFKLLKKPNLVGAAAFRGTAVESGVAHGLMTGATDEECIEVAKKEFFRLSALSGDPARDKEEAAVPAMVGIALKELRGYGPPTSTQGEINFRFDEVAVAFKGFYDFEWSNHNILVDLKTSHALTSKVSTNHARQVSLYVAALGYKHDPRVTYVTPKKSATYRVENVAEHLDALRRTGIAIQNFLSISEDPMELASLVIPDVESYFFKDAATRQAVFETWGV